VNTVSAPATEDSDPAVTDGANAVRAQSAPSIANEVEAVAGAPPHGMTATLLVCGPHCAALASSARAPPLNAMESRENGTCGWLSKTVVIWPVVGSVLTEPASLTSAPWPAAATPRRNGSAAVPASRYTAPSIGAAVSGETSSTVPTFEPSGH
jgi:hypothetical protein